MIFAALPERLSEVEIDEMLKTADKDGNYIMIFLFLKNNEQ